MKGFNSMAKEKKDFIKIAVMGGDGTGPEVVREGLKVLETVSKIENFKYELVNYDLGAERYLRTGEVCPDSVVEELRKFDAIYLGAVGHPDVKPGILEKGLLLKLRFELDQYINLRPVKLYPGVDCPLKDKGPEHIDFVVVRENTEGIYTGMGGVQYKGMPSEVSTQVNCTTRFGAERAVRFAFDYCRSRNNPKKQVTLVHKTNVLTFAGDTWFRAFNEIGEKEYPDIKRDYNHVDACTMWFVKNPEFYDVIVTDNLFGDIITDLAAMIQGGLGVAAGGNINPNGVSMFEPMGGSAPKYMGKNIINPIAAIGAMGLLLREAGQENAGNKIEAAIMKTTPKMKSQSAGKMGFSTSELGDLVAKTVTEL
jgi:3-isopropylmalate dehydrogenase